MNRHGILIINKGQLGTLIDALKWCEYLSHYYSITYVGFNSGLPKVKIGGVREIAVPAIGPRFIRGTLYTLVCLWHILWFRGKIMVVYYPSCHIFKRVFPYKRMLLDIRTLSINPDMEANLQYNNQLRATSRLYDEVSAISEGVAKKIGLNNIHILPLGADKISDTVKNYSDGIRLLYVGTFQGRQLEKTIKGVMLFHQSHPNIPLSYTLIGDSNHGELQQLKTLVKELHMDDIITFTGRLPYNQLKTYFDKANIGISFIPITEYYNDQPPTKTYEYVMSGLYCVATNTKSNAAIITENNGTLIADMAESVCEALWEFWNKKERVCQQKIEGSVQNSSWGLIVKNNLLPILEAL